MTKTETDLETSAYSPFNLLTRLPAPEYFIEFIAKLRLSLRTEKSADVSIFYSCPAAHCRHWKQQNL